MIPPLARPSHRGFSRQTAILFSVREQLVLDELEVLCGLSSRGDVIRLALQRLCDHYDMDRGGVLFRFRGPRGVKKRTGA